MKKKDEPDFYKLDKTNRLPSLQDAPIPGAAAASLALRQQQQSLPVTSNASVVTRQSPTTTIVTPPSMSPSVMNNMSVMNHSNLVRSNNNAFNIDPLVGQSEGVVSNMGVMGLTGMGQSRLNNDLGPMPPRFNGYNANIDAFDLHDEYDLQFGLNSSRLLGASMGNQSLNMNSELGFSGLGSAFNGGLVGYGDISGSGRFGGIHSNPSGIRRSALMRQQLQGMDMMSNISSNDGLIGRSNTLSSVQDLYPTSYSQQQHTNNIDEHNTFSQQLNHISPQRFNQFQQQYQESSPSVHLQQVNSMGGSSMQMLGRGMNTMGHDDYISSGVRRSTSRLSGH
jgi:hypothetical protein